MEQLTLWPVPPAWLYRISNTPEYHRDWYAQNVRRRRAQRLASKWGGHFRDYLRGCV